MKLSHPVLKVNTPTTYSLSDRRYAKRIPIQYRVAYFKEEGARIVKGAGASKNLSKTGCSMVLGATTSSLGSRLTLLLDVEDGQAPMRLTDVLVSWIAKDSFAVKFPMLSPEQRKRLQDVILKNIGLSYLDDRRATFRIVSPSI